MDISIFGDMNIRVEERFSTAWVPQNQFAVIDDVTKRIVGRFVAMSDAEKFARSIRLTAVCDPSYLGRSRND